MNCPDCLKLNVNSKIILLSSIYVCENESCFFCEPTEKIEELYGFKTNIDNIIDVSNKIDFLDLNNEQIEAESADSFKLQSLGESYNNSSDKCSVNDHLYKKETHVDSVYNKSNEAANEMNKLDTNSMNSSHQFEDIEIIDLNDEFNNFSEFEPKLNDSVKVKTTQKCNGNIVGSDTLKSIEQMSDEYFSRKFFKTSNKIFNWLRMPYHLKTHSKIIRLLLLHLDIFKFKDPQKFDCLKRQYSICETFANHYPIDRVKHYFYGFLHQLYNIVDHIPNKNLIDAEMDERIMCSLNRLFDKYDVLNHLKFKYRTEILCSFCHDHRIIEESNYFLQLERGKVNLKVKENQISYQFNCLKCKKKSTKTILFKQIPQFVIFHCPKGLQEDITRYNNRFVSVDNRQLSVVAVIEVGSKYPYQEYPEREMDYFLYASLATVHDTRNKPNYCLHFRNTNGWYSLNGFKRFVCSPNEELSVYSLSDVRFVILGTISDPNTYRSYFSIQDFTKAHDEYVKGLFREMFCQPDSNSCDKTCNTQQISEKSTVEKKTKQTRKNLNYLRPKRPTKLKTKLQCKGTKNIDKENETQHSAGLDVMRDGIKINADKIFCFPFEESRLSSEISPTPFYPSLSLFDSVPVSPNTGQDVEPSDLDTDTVAATNTSSRVSSLSLFDNDNLYRIRAQKMNEFSSQSTSSFSSNHSSKRVDNNKSRKHFFSIDDLIHRQAKKLKENQ